MFCYIKVACDYNGKSKAIIQYCMFLSSGISFYEFWMEFHVSFYSSLSFFFIFDIHKSLFHLSIFHSHFRETLWKRYITKDQALIFLYSLWNICIYTNQNIQNICANLEMRCMKWCFGYHFLFSSVCFDFYWNHWMNTQFKIEISFDLWFIVLLYQ